MLATALKELADSTDRQTAADTIVRLANQALGQRALMLAPVFPEPLTPSELQKLERIAYKQWLSAKAVWLALHPREPYEHQVSINLGRQLSVHFPKQRKQGPTRMYWIESKAIATPQA